MIRGIFTKIISFYPLQLDRITDWGIFLKSSVKKSIFPFYWQNNKINFRLPHQKIWISSFYLPPGSHQQIAWTFLSNSKSFCLLYLCNLHIWIIIVASLITWNSRYTRSRWFILHYSPLFFLRRHFIPPVFCTQVTFGLVHYETLTEISSREPFCIFIVH